MTTTKVESSNISEIGFDNGTLSVAFKGGNVYTYAQVPSELHDAFLAAESKGKFFAENIKGKFETKKVEPKTAKALAEELLALIRADIDKPGAAVGDILGKVIDVLMAEGKK